MNGIEHQKPKTVLVDNCVLDLAETVQEGTKRVEVPWGDITVTTDIVGLVGKTPRDTTQQVQRECLPTIVRLVRNGTLLLHKTTEVAFEAWHRAGAAAPLPGYLFASVPFIDIPPAIERSRLRQTEIGQHVQGDAVAQFCQWLRGVDEKRLLSEATFREHITPQEAANLGNLGRFRELCKGLSPDQCRDAFHLWTAEVNGLDYFLTVDTKFIRALTMRGKKPDLPCLPVTPSDLLDIMGVTERDPLPFVPGRFYNSFEDMG